MKSLGKMVNTGNQESVNASKTNENPNTVTEKGVSAKQADDDAIKGNDKKNDQKNDLRHMNRKREKIKDIMKYESKMMTNSGQEPENKSMRNGDIKTTTCEMEGDKAKQIDNDSFKENNKERDKTAVNEKNPSERAQKVENYQRNHVISPDTSDSQQ